MDGFIHKCSPPLVVGALYMVAILFHGGCFPEQYQQEQCGYVERAKIFNCLYAK